MQNSLKMSSPAGDVEAPNSSGIANESSQGAVFCSQSRVRVYFQLCAVKPCIAEVETGRTDGR